MKWNSEKAPTAINTIVMFDDTSRVWIFLSSSLFSLSCTKLAQFWSPRRVGKAIAVLWKCKRRREKVSTKNSHLVRPKSPNPINNRMLHRKLLLRRSELHNVSGIAIKSFSIYAVPRVSTATSSTNQSLGQQRRWNHQSVEKPKDSTPSPTPSTLVTFTQQSVVYIVHAVVDIIRNPKATWQYIKHEAEHYWLGTKLLWSEIKLATKIFSRVLYGHGMTRR